MHYLIALYAAGLLIYPLWGLLDPASYAAEMSDEFIRATVAGTDQVQLAAILHWFRNTYLAFALLLLVRYINEPQQPVQVRRAGLFIAAFPLVDIAYRVLAQVAMSAGPDELEINLHLQAESLFYCVVGFSLIGISRTLAAPEAPPTPEAILADSPEERS